MTVFYDKARNRWRFDFQLGGVRYARECLDESGKPATSRRAAMDAESDARRIAKISPKLPRSSELTIAEVLAALSEGWQRKPGWRERQAMVREILDFFGHGTPMRQIDGSRVQDYITFALAQPVRIWTGGPKRNPGALAKKWKQPGADRTRSPARVNRYLPIIRAALERAFNTRDPLTGQRAIDEVLAIKDLPENKRKARPVPDDVLDFLKAILPPHVVDGITLTLCFGFRRSEAFRLREAQVDWRAAGVRLQAERVKDREDVFLPASQFAMGYLRCLAMEADSRGSRFLITWRGLATDERKLAAAPWVPIKSPKSAWTRAMRAVEAKFGQRWRWHDIRAAFITHVAMNSGALAAQRLARHSDFKTTQAYIEVADQVMRDAAERASARPTLGVIEGGKR